MESLILYIADPAKALSTVSSIFLQRNLVPIAPQVILKIILKIFTILVKFIGHPFWLVQQHYSQTRVLNRFETVPVLNRPELKFFVYIVISLKITTFVDLMFIPVFIAIIHFHQKN